MADFFFLLSALLSFQNMPYLVNVTDKWVFPLCSVLSGLTFNSEDNAYDTSRNRDESDTVVFLL